jgi:DNA-binding NtrC family response regulator
MIHTLSQSLRLLVVDDDPAMVTLMTGAVRHFFGPRFEIHATTNVAEARDWIDARAFDFVITDIEMPSGDGLELLRYAKQGDSWTQVVIITGHSTWDRVTTALEAGASDYLLKPIRLVDIESVLREGCNRLGRWQHAAHGTRAMERRAETNAN